MRARERGQGDNPLVVAAAASAAAAALVVLLDLWGAPQAPTLAMLVSGLLPVLAGVALWPLPALRRSSVPAYRRWLAAALLVAGGGQIVHAFGALAASPALGPSFPTAADLLAILAAPLTVVGLVVLARSAPGLSDLGVPAARVLLDSLLLGLALTLLLWRFVFSGEPTAGTAATVLAVAALVTDLVIGCMAALLALCRPVPHLLVAALGVGAIVAGYVFILARALPASSHWSWPGEALLCAGWPLIAAGMLSNRALPPPPAHDPPVDVDAKLSVVTVTGTTTVLVVGVLAILMRPTVYRVSLVLTVVLLVVVWVREIFATSQRTSLVRRLHAEATRDPLTGLANRRDLTRRLGQVQARQSWCLLTLDLDAFKTVNDVLGHGIGDRLLQAVAVRLREVVPAPAMVARVGGDEFAVLLPAAAPDGQRLAEELIAAVRRACGDVPGVDRLGVSASVGVSAVPAPASGPDPLSALSAAGAAQQIAKAAGRDRVQLFDDDAARLRRRRLTVEERLRAAVAAEAIRLEYQPIVDLGSGRLAGVEALARWLDDELGPVAPEEFIAVAEESGLVVPLGELVLHQAIRQAVEADLPASNIRISCNVSPLQLRVPGFHRVVEGALAAHRMHPESVVIEVTEAALVEEEGVAVRTLRLLDDLGVGIAIDDFGTGYSALNYLQRLPASILKIDKSLTMRLTEDSRTRAIFQAVTDLGRGIGASVVVEGLESAEVADLVRGMGAQYGQGSLFGAARPLDEVTGPRALAATNNALPPSTSVPRARSPKRL